MATRSSLETPAPAAETWQGAGCTLGVPGPPPPVRAARGGPCPGTHLRTPAPVVLAHPEVEESVSVGPRSKGVPKEGLPSQKSPSQYIVTQAFWSGSGPSPRSYESTVTSVGCWRENVGC